MSAFHIWKDDPPPPETWVLAKYALTGPAITAEWQRVRTCKHGCCVSDGWFNLNLPKYWKELA